MIYIETGSSDVYYNFGLEYYFTVEKQLEDTVFLFWQTAPTLMVGKYQNTLEEINKAYADAHGIQIVRRLSGGGTIYTDPGGWQFTFIQYGDTEQIHFTDYISPVIGALRALGVEAEFNGRNDLVIGGRKFSGNAQYKLAGNTVHHGSLLFQTDIEQMVKSTTVDPYKIISRSIQSVRDRVTNISDHLPVPMDGRQFKKHMVSHLMQGSQKEYRPTSEDVRRIKEIAAERFDNWESKFGSNPRFSITKTGRFAGGKLEVQMDVKKGVIESAAVFGDFFGTERAERLAEALTGCRYERTDVLRRLREEELEGCLYGISLEEIAATVAD